MAVDDEMPAEFDDLPEPARAKAFEFLRELLAHGSSEQEAIAQALQQTRSWIAERARTAE